MVAAVRPLPGWCPVLAAAWMALVLGRYVDVMSPALYGRPINLYWDCGTCRP